MTMEPTRQIPPLAALGQDGKGPMSVRMTIKGADGSADAHHDKADAHHDKRPFTMAKGDKG